MNDDIGTPLQELAARRGDVMPPRVPGIPVVQGSRRRRLWELIGHAHCPVVGVCLPVAELRAILSRADPGCAPLSDYELHCHATALCKKRNDAAVAVQRDLERRYALAVQQAARLKDAAALRQWWKDALNSHVIAGPLWAVLTHPRCSQMMADDVLGDVHMLQHQAGAAERTDARRLRELTGSNAELKRSAAMFQARHAGETAERAHEAESLRGEIIRLRAELIGRDTLIASLRAEFEALRASVPDLTERLVLARRSDRQQERIQTLELALGNALRQADAVRREAAGSESLRQAGVARRAEVPGSAGTAKDGKEMHEALAAPLMRLDNHTVLCVGGRTASVPHFRKLIEGIGGQFLHHDGGEQQSPAQLDSTLATADMVICQTGCVSHDAYWRVKDHCKRTGKRCVFVETPSASSLRRALFADVVDVNP